MELDLIIYLKTGESLSVQCDSEDAVLGELYAALKNNAGNTDNSNDQAIRIPLRSGKDQYREISSQQIVGISTQPLDIQEDTRTPPFNDERKSWIWNLVRRGCNKDTLFKALIDEGYTRDEIQFELNHTPAVPVEHIETSITDPMESTNPLQIPGISRIETDKAEIYIMDGFLADQTCADLTKTIESNLRKSPTVLDSHYQGLRTSQTCHFNQLNKSDSPHNQISSHLCNLVKIPENHMEPVQGQLYETGGEYKPHYDWFEPLLNTYSQLAGPAKGGQRDWSFIVYLNNVDEGGETRFGNLNKTIQPKTGRLVFWKNRYPNGLPNPDVIHQALPVTKGRKIVLTLWSRVSAIGT